MKTKAFTLIELLIVISIIIVVSTAWAFSFFDFLKKRELNLKLNEIEQFIVNKDKKINSKEIFDYKLTFDTNIKDYFYVYENLIDSNNTVRLLTDSKKLRLDKELENNQLWQISIFENWKLEKNETNKEYDFTLNKNNVDYQIKNNIIIKTENLKDKKIPLNNIEIIRLDKENQTENKIQLLGISSNENKIMEWVVLDIENISWKKTFYLDSNKIENVYLFFEKEWINSFINLKK